MTTSTNAPLSVHITQTPSVSFSTITLPGPGPYYLSDGDDSYAFNLTEGINTEIDALGGNDTIYAYGGHATIYGGTGNDYLYANGYGAYLDGGDNNDILLASGGQATLIGGNGNDTMYAANTGVGINALDGGAGDDFLQVLGVGTAILTGGAGNDTMYGGADGSTTLFFGGIDNDVIHPSAGTAWIDGGDGFDVVNYDLSVTGVQIYLTNQQQNAGGAVGQVFVGIEQYLLSYSSDYFVASDAAVIACGQQGNDALIGGRADDTLDGGSGNDYLVGGDGNDILRGGDAVTFGGFVLDPGGDDSIYGGNGNDIIIAGDGNDILGGGVGADTLNGGDGFDTVGYWDAGAPISIDLTKASSTWTGDAQGDSLFSVEAFALSGFDDTFVGSDVGVTVSGGGGKDIVTGGAGADTFDGWSGDDTLVGGAGNDVLLGGDPATNRHGTAISESGGADILDGGAGDDLLNGETANDTLYGGDGNDTLLGGDDYIGRGGIVLESGGDDVLYGGDGNDNLDGRDGNDLLDGGAGADMLTGGDGWDTASYQDATAGVSIDLTKASSTWSGDAQGDVMSLIEQIDLSNFADILHGDADNNFVRGGNGVDLLDGGDGDDWLDGGAGADILTGGIGFDTVSYLDAAAGVSIDLAKSSSTWTGDAQGDIFNSIESFGLSNFADIFRGDANVNNVNGGTGDDQIFGAGGDDVLSGGSGSDTIQGGDGNDVLRGEGWGASSNQGDDYIQGNAGDDIVYGEGGNDRMVGGTGNDTLVGGLGGDYLAGSEGADIFKYTAVEESQNILINGVSQQDQIADFTQGQDKIDLSAIDANPALAGDQAFTFIADPTHYTGDWTGVVWQTTAANGIVTINVSIDGDADPEMQIYMSHPYQFTANDFNP